MPRTVVSGIGSYVPERVVTNDDLRFLNDQHVRQDTEQMETSDEWIQKRTGIRERRFVPNDGSVATSDLGLWAAQAALSDAGVDAGDLDCIIFATLSPDIQFPGTGVFVQKKLGVAGPAGCPCYDIRQQCSGFVYGLQIADSFIKTGLYRRILLVGAELHSHSLDYSTRGRDVTVLFGDGAGAFVLEASDDPGEGGLIYTDVGADGSGARLLYLELMEINKLPYVSYDPKDPEQNETMYPHMEGKKVFIAAVRTMAMSAKNALEASGLGWDDIDWFVPHQANLRINQKVVEVAKIPPEKALSTIEFYGNTTAATVPLTIDHWRREGRIKPGDRCLATVFGSGFTWGSAIFTV